MNSEINGRRYQPICRTVVPPARTPPSLPVLRPPVPRTLYRPGEKGRREREWSSNYGGPARVTSPSTGIVSLTYENTLSDSGGGAHRRGIRALRVSQRRFLSAAKFIRPEYIRFSVKLLPCAQEPPVQQCCFSETGFPIDTPLLIHPA